MMQVIAITPMKLLAVGLAMLLGIVVGLAPAWRTMKLSIVDALFTDKLGEH